MFWRTELRSVIAVVFYIYILDSIVATPTDYRNRITDESLRSSFALSNKLENEILQQVEDNGYIKKVRRTKRELNVIQAKIVDFVDAKPIVDTMKETDKDGNMVDHVFGKKIVKAVENLSNIINSVFSFPVNAARKATKNVTEILNNVGGKIVGLQ
ncbi:uncharacterized protein LOC142320289 isoform X2 [Lycorma delicatula]